MQLLSFWAALEESIWAGNFGIDDKSSARHSRAKHGQQSTSWIAGLALTPNGLDHVGVGQKGSLYKLRQGHFF